jgi:holo-[acyl-carrier protein] synthase
VAVNENIQVRVGTDVQSIDEVADSIARFGESYVRRVYTDHEVECSGGATRDAAPRLAARFAAKEATIKALRMTEEFSGWTEIEVRRQPGGWCELQLHGEAKRLAELSGVRQLALSMSHGAGIATATVVGLFDAPGRPQPPPAGPDSPPGSGDRLLG